MAVFGKHGSRLFGIERRILIGFLAASALCLAFLHFASEVMEGETLAFDRRILLALRTPGNLAVPIGPAWLKFAMTDITALGGFTLLTLITVFAVCYLLAARKTVTAAIVAGSVVSGVIGSTLLKAVFLRTRPDIVPHLVAVQSASFPSGHAMNSAVTYLTLGALLASAEKSRRVRVFLMSVAIFLTLAIGISRVYLGVHWPSDVIAGWCVGSAWAVLCSMTARALRRAPVRGD